jgi:hypothetical protein
VSDDPPLYERPVDALRHFRRSLSPRDAPPPNCTPHPPRSGFVQLRIELQSVPRFRSKTKIRRGSAFFEGIPGARRRALKSLDAIPV